MTTQERKVYRANLRKWFRKATPKQRALGMVWYSEAQEFVQELSLESNRRFTSFQTAGLTSALSPNNKWERNKHDARQVMHAVIDGKQPEDVKVCTYNPNKIKGFKIMLGEVKITPASPKTYAFAQNVGNLSANHVTIDKWHLRACQTSSSSPKTCKTSVTAKQYKEIEQDTLIVAREFGLKGYEFQAIVWITIRNHWNNN